MANNTTINDYLDIYMLVGEAFFGFNLVSMLFYAAVIV